MTTTKPARLLVLAALVLACAGPGAAEKAPPQAAAPVAASAPPPPAVAPPVPAGPDRTTIPSLGPAPELRLPEQKHFVLSNGLKVRLVEYPRLPIVALHLVVDAGGARDPARLPGTAGFAAGMLTEGTKTRTATRISDEVGFLGASLSAGAGFDAAFLSGSTLSKHLPKYLDVFADVAMNPAFPKADFKRVQDQRRVAILQARDQPQLVAAMSFQPTFWGDHPYGHLLMGTEPAVLATRPNDLAAFHRAFWRPGSAELVVVGDVSVAELQPLLERSLGAWKKGPRATPLPAAGPAAPHRAVLVDKPEAPQTFLIVGMPGLDRASEDYVAASVAFEILGGGMSSRLFRNLREEKGYTYGIGAGADARRLAGATVVRGSVKADVTGPAIREVLKELARLRDEPVPAEELDDAKNAIVRGLPADFSSVGGIAGRVAELALFGLPDDYWNRYADAVQEVTAEDVRRIAQKYVDPARMTVVMVGAPGVVEPQLAGLPLGQLQVKPAPGTEPGKPARRVAPAKAPAPVGAARRSAAGAGAR
jgi:zinc protease